MSRTTATTVILFVSLVICYLADAMGASGAMSEEDQQGWGWFATWVFVIWCAVLVVGDHRDDRRRGK
jgi:hypothetical protein